MSNVKNQMYALSTYLNTSWHDTGDNARTVLPVEDVEVDDDPRTCEASCDEGEPKKLLKCVPSINEIS